MISDSVILPTECSILSERVEAVGGVSVRCAVEVGVMLAK